LTAKDRLDAASVLPRLSTRWLARSYHWFDEIDSTNRVALELGRSGAVHGTTVVAEAQSAGRGRLGRSFFSPAYRNLYTSIVLRHPVQGTRAGTLVFAAALAVAEAIEAELEAAGRACDILAIKWPNDVLLGGLKTSGVLVETTGTEPGRFSVLGIGVTLNVQREEFPGEFRARATSLAAFLGTPVDRVGFAACLYGKLENQLDRHEGGGFGALRAAYEERFRMVGSRVHVTGGPAQTAPQQLEGIVLGIADDGALRLRREDGREERVLAGDVTIVKEPAS
jgi:BirA family biotin operon repressor/biotin-[acetyl-CoA-carboxylase] ligase